MHAFYAATKQRRTKLKEKNSKVEQSSTAKTSQRGLLKGSAAVAAGGLAAVAVSRELIRDLEDEINKVLREAGF